MKYWTAKEEQINEDMIAVVQKKGVAFCYHCYKDAPTGLCNSCGSDDLMIKLPGVGCEYGLDWAIKDIITSELNAIDEKDLEERYDQLLCDIYGETTKVGWFEVDTAQLIKDTDPVSYRMGLDEYINDMHEEQEVICSWDGGKTYYWTDDVESLIYNETKSLPVLASVG